MSFTLNIYSQKGFNVSAGTGFPAIINISMHYNIEQYAIGITGGSWPNKDLLSVSSDIRIHIAGSSEYTEIKPWYLLFNINYLRDNGNISDHKYYYFGFGVGKEFNLSKRIGLDLNLGLLGVISHEEIRKSCFDCPLGGVEVPVLPTITLGIFYRIYNL